MPTDECLELKTIKYKSMLHDYATSPGRNREQVTDLDDILSKDANREHNQPWNKLNKQVKIAKLHDYADIYCLDNTLSEDYASSLKSYLDDLLSKRQLQKAKDVAYNKATGAVKSIPNLILNEQTKTFHIKNMDKKVSPMASLAPKNKKRTVKKKVTHNHTPKNRKIQSVAEAVE